MVWVGFAISWLAWALLALGLPRHYRELFRREPAGLQMRMLRLGGWLLMVVSFALSIQRHGWGQGPIFWASTLVLGALVWVLAMTLWRARRG